MIERLRRKAASRRGNIMVHVLVTAIIVMIIAAGLMRLVMIRYIAVQRATDSSANKRLAEAAVAGVLGAWNTNGANCTSSPTALPGGLSLSGGGAGSCSCTVTGSGTFATVVLTASTVGGACQLSVVSGQ